MYLQLIDRVPNEISPVVLSSLTTRNLYGSDVVVAGWGNTNNGDIPGFMETVKLKVLANRECEQRAWKLQGKSFPIHERLLCTAANPYALLSYVSEEFVKNLLMSLKIMKRIQTMLERKSFHFIFVLKVLYK
jgi:hypothetical protein